MNWMDYLLILLMAFNVLRGYQRGLIMTVASLASYLAGWWSAVTYSGQAAEALMGTDTIYQPVFQWIRQWLEKRSEENGFSHLVEDSLQEPWFSLPLPRVAQNWLQQPESAAELIENAETLLLDQAAVTLTQIMISFIAFILVFLVVKNGVYFVGILINGIFKLPLLNALNRGGGLAAGLVRGLLVIWVLLILATPLVAADPQGNVATALRNSALLETLPWLSF